MLKPLFLFFSFFIFYKHNRTPTGKKSVTGVQVVTASQVQSYYVLRELSFSDFASADGIAKKEIIKFVGVALGRCG